MSYRELPSGEPRWDVEYYVDGKRKQETCYSEEQALDRHAEIRTDKRRGEYLDPRDGRITLERYARDEWLPSKNFAIGTHQQVVNRLEKHVFPVLGKLRLDRVRPTTVRSWSNRMNGAESTKAVVFVHLQDIFTCAVEDRRIPSNPCTEGSVQRGKPRAPIGEVRDIWSADRVNAQTEALRDRYRIVVTLGSKLGLRPGEMFGLSPDDVDWLANRGRGVVHVNRTLLRLADGRRIFKLPKYDKVRKVPLFDGAKDELAAHLAEFPAREVTHAWEEFESGKVLTVPLIVTTPTGRSVDLSRFNTEEWRPALEGAGIPFVPRKSGPHHCRHYFVSTMLAVGYSIEEVSKWVGHSDPAFTQRRYGHVIERPDEAVLERRLAEFHAGGRTNGESRAVTDGLHSV